MIGIRFIRDLSNSALSVKKVFGISFLGKKKMANEQNLEGKSFNELTADKQREIARQGGIASGKARAEKRDLRKALEMLLEKEWKDKRGNSLTGTEAISAKLFEQAMNGNIKAFETIRSTVGQDPVQKVMIAEVDQDVIDEVERAVLNE